MAVTNTRLCVFQGSDNSQKKLVMYPNMAVSNDRLGNILPKETKSIAPARQLIEECFANQELHVQMANRSCELIVVRLNPGTGYECFSCNSTFLTHNSLTVGATVLHVFQHEQASTVQYSILNLSQTQRAHEIQALMNKWYRNWRTAVASNLSKYVRDSPGLFLLPPMESNPVALEFLEMRKSYIESHRNQAQLMVPGWKLHPLPSIDMLLFSLPPDLESIVRQQQLSYQLSARPQPAPNDVVYMSGFQSNQQVVSFQPSEKNLDYGMVAQATKNSVRWNKQMQQPQKASLYVNSGRSLSVCRNISMNECMMAFQGNTLQGSSGSPLYDSEGRLLALNFGYLCDYIDDYGHRQHPETASLFDYDIDLQHLQSKSQYNSFKNVNLAVRVDCPPVHSFLNR